MARQARKRMKIHELKYLPVQSVTLKNAAAAAPAEAVSLYGHWCHIRQSDGSVVSVPVSSVLFIKWV